MKALISFAVWLIATSVIAQQTHVDTNLVNGEKLYREIHDKITWGKPTTNGLQLGMFVSVKDADPPKRFNTFTYLYDETNSWFGFYPPHGCRLKISVQNVIGADLQKTKAGDQVTQTMGSFSKLKMRFRDGADTVPEKTPIPFENGFNILDCFKIDQPGMYTLTINGSVYKRKMDESIYEIVLPPASVKIAITKADIDAHRNAGKAQ